MPPKLRFSKEEIIDAALALVREKGADALTARALATCLGASTKPIFGLFRSMEEVQTEVLSAADSLYRAYLEKDMAEGRYPPYKASGMAYIRFAREEGELFRLLFMRDRTGERPEEDRDAIRPLLTLIMKNTGADEEQAYRLHVELWIFVHGMAAMIATSYLPWDEAFVSRALSDAYAGLTHVCLAEAKNLAANGDPAEAETKTKKENKEDT